jgi:Domain of unknown function (DUF4173)
MRAAALAAALAAAAFLPGEPLGIGVLLVAVLVAVAARAGTPLGAQSMVLGVLALLLAAVPAVLDADWVIALDLTAAWLLACAAVGGLSLGAPLGPLVRLRGAPALAPGVPAGIAPAVRGTVLGGLLVVPFGALFVQADAAFSELAEGVPLPSLGSLPGRIVVFALVLLAAVGLALTARWPVRARIPRPGRKLAPWEWGIALGLLVALFLAFVLVQLTVLFGGRRHVLETAGVTYAEYARQGFWQLLAAAGLTLVVIGAALAFAAAPERKHRIGLRLLLGALCGLTIVVLVSALHRLLLYEDAFGLTRSRLFAEAVAVWLGGLFALLVAAGLVRIVAANLARIAVVGTAVTLLGFSLASPDALVAERNVDRWRDTGRIDVLYLQELSADAAPALSELPPHLRVEALRPLGHRLEEPEPWSSFNLSRDEARDVLATLDD